MRANLSRRLPNDAVSFSKNLPWLKILLGVLAVALGLVVAELLSDTPKNAGKLAIGIFTIHLIAIGWFTRKSQSTWADLLVTALILGVAVCAVRFETRDQLNGFHEIRNFHGWNLYHYVLGTKYFDEVGYYDLYPATILADREGDNVLKKANTIRDMHTYKKRKLTQVLTPASSLKIRKKFTDRRWEKYKSDLDELMKLEKKKKWKKVVNDLGFNPSPAWLVLHKPLLNTVDLDSRKSFSLLSSAQHYLFAITLIFSIWAFGWRTTSIATIWLVIWRGNAGRFVGGYFSYDFFCLIVIFFALFTKGWRKVSTLPLSYAAMMRGFPGLLAGFAGIKWMREYLRDRKIPKQTTLFLLWLAAGCTLFAIWGGATNGGMGVWMDWKDKISTHAKQHPAGSNRIGLAMIFTQPLDDFQQEDIGKKQRLKNLKRNRNLLTFAKWTLIALAILAMIRRNDNDAILIGLIIVWALVVVSRYYFSAWVLLFCWSALDRRRLLNLFSQLYLFGAVIAMLLFYMEKLPQRNAHLYFNLILLPYFLLMIVQFLVRDFRRLKSAGIPRRG